MDIGIVRMRVRQGRVVMRVRMRLRIRYRRVAGTVDMLMMLVMDVRMRMIEWFMHVLVLVPFGEVKPHTNRHERRGEQECRRRSLAKDDE